MAQRLTNRSKIKAAKPKKEKKAKKPTRRMTPSEVAEVVEGSNVTDATIRERIKATLAAHATAKSAQATYRNELKTCKQAGIDPSDVTFYIATKAREPEDVQREVQRRNRILRVMRYPLGHQLGLFDDGKSVARTVEDETIAETKAEEAATTKRKRVSAEMLDKAAESGFEGGKLGIARDSNPHEEGSPEWIKWDWGWVGGSKAPKDADAAAFADTGSS